MAEPNQDQQQSRAAAGVQRQIILPMSKAVEIAYKNIRMRLSRSLLVTSGIVLALAFLMYILADEAIIGGMREWVGTTTADTAYFAELAEQRRVLDNEIREPASALQAAVQRGGAVPGDAPALDAQQHFGAELPDLQRELGALPAPVTDLERALRREPQLIPVMQRWIDLRQELMQVQAQWTAPQQLEAMMRARGVPTTPEQIAQDRLQTRWIIGLALLVAFVGILNAMLMSVTERFREIGTMKCLGALDSFIVKLFLIESAFQGAIGTIFGIGLGLVLSMVGAWSIYGSYMWMMFPYGALLSAAAVCFVVGVGLTISGAVYPAWQAARMQPIEAMRVET